MIRFPGQASPATVSISWQAWTTPRAAVRFPGQASPALAPLAWTWTTPQGSPQPAPPQPAPPPPAPRDPQARPTPTRVAAPSARSSIALPEPPTDILHALATAQNAVADAHGTYLAQQDHHLATLGELQASLTRLLDAKIAG